MSGDEPKLGRARNGATVLAYEVLGEHGPWLVMVHGLGYGRLGWGPMADMLAAHRRLVLIDNRGIGESDRPPGPYTADDMAGDVLAVMDDLGLQTADIVGASLGGMVTLQLAASYPGRVSRMVLIAATPGPPQGVPLPPRTMALLQGRVRRRADTARRLVEGALAPAPAARRQELVDRLMAVRARQTQHPEGWQAQAAVSAGFSLRSGLGALRVPTLVIAGTDDAVVDPVNTMRLAFGLPHARGLFLAPAGHLCFWEEPEILAQAIDDFLGTTGLSADGTAAPVGGGTAAK